MAFGPGKYDALATYCREAANAEGALVIVFAGDRGHGFSAQVPPRLLPNIPAVLRLVADSIERDAGVTAHP